MIDHMDHPDLLPEFVELQDKFLADVLFDYRENEISDWLSNLTRDDMEAIVNREPMIRSNRFVIPFLYIRYRAIPRRDVVDYLRNCLDVNNLIPDNNTVLVRTRTNFHRIFSERSDYTYRG